MRERLEVLIADACTNDIAQIVRFFRCNPCDWQLTFVRGGKALIDRLREHSRPDIDGLREHSRPDLVLLELALPELSGIEVMRVLKANEFLRSIPVIVLSRTANEVDILEAYNSGAATYFVRPSSNTEFAALLHTIYGYWQAVRLPYVF